MKRIDTNLKGVAILEPMVFGDQRGFFEETYNRRTFADVGIETEFIQDNHSRSARHVLRGLHWQIGKPQAKLVRVAAGAVYDVVVDIRRESPTFGKWTGLELSAENHRMLFVPRGFAHGFLVLSEMADFLYKCDNYYAPEEERGIIWNDNNIGIDWPLTEGCTPILSQKDQENPTLENTSNADLFVYGEV